MSYIVVCVYFWEIWQCLKRGPHHDNCLNKPLGNTELILIFLPKRWTTTTLLLTQWGRVTHTFLSNLNIIGSDNGLLPDRHQTVNWTDAGILLTHWGRATHICVGKLTIIGSDNGLSPAWTAPSHYLNQYWNAVNWTVRKKLQWNFNRNSNIFIQEMDLKISSAKWRPFCLGPNELIRTLGTNVSEISNEIHTFSFENVVCEMAAIHSWPQCVKIIDDVRSLFQTMPLSCFHWNHAIAHEYCMPSPCQIISPSTACMRQWTRSALVQVMACWLFDAKLIWIRDDLLMIKDRRDDVFGWSAPFDQPLYWFSPGVLAERTTTRPSVRKIPGHYLENEWKKLPKIWYGDESMQTTFRMYLISATVYWFS